MMPAPPVRPRSFSTCLALLLALAAGPAACRGCAERSDAPTPPPSDAAALPAAPASAVAQAAERFTAARGRASGEWIELQVAQPGASPAAGGSGASPRFERWHADSLFLSPDAMAFFHDAFARSLAGWNPFVPQLLDAEALGRLDERLETLDRELEATPDVVGAKARWAGVSSLVSGMSDDASWSSARVALRGTIRDLRAFCKRLRDQGERLWVLS
jgi:hypothetical protein